MTDNEKERKQE